MGCRIHYAVRDGMLQAVVSGRAIDRNGGGHEAWIAQDIAAEAGRQALTRVLIDLRGLADRLGSLGALSLSRVERRRVRGYRVAVVDALAHESCYALHEMAARARGFVLRCFASSADAARWLRSAPSLD